MAAPSFNLSIVVPFYNEDARLGAFQEEMTGFLREAGHLACQVILVNDGSRTAP